MNEAYCRRCDRYEAAAGRRPFAMPGAKPRYAPDRPAAIEHIALTLRFDFDDKVLFGTCRTTFRAVGAPLQSLEMDADHLSIQSVRSAAGKRLAFELAAGKLLIDLGQKFAAGKSGSVTVVYEARQPTQGIYFISPDRFYPHKPVQVWTQGQDQDAHYWFPCIDYPNARATTEVTATVPQDFFVLSNGALVKTTVDARAKTKSYHWKMDVPHVTYLVSCVAGKFAEHTDKLNELPVSYYVPPGREADGRRAFGKTPKMLQFFADRIGVAYPYAKYAQVAVADFIFGGMENTSATTQTDTTLHDARAHLDFSSDGLVAHELAHQWFGDLLTCRDWSHAWLNEGFATYFEAMFKEFDLGADEFDYYRLALAQRYFEEEQKRYRRAIVTNVYNEPIDLFDRHLYEKAACVLHLVRRMLGDELWWRTINYYVSENRLRNVESVDFIRAIETVTGKNMLPFFDQWIFKAGHPEFRVHYRWDDETKAAVVRVEQTQEAAEGVAAFRVPLTLAFLKGKTEARFTVDLEDREQTFTITPGWRPEIFCFDPNGDIIKKTELRVPVEMLIRQSLATRNLPARIDAISALAKHADAATVQALGQILNGRAFWGVKVQAAAALAQIRTDAAFQMLTAARSVNHPKARRGVARALGEFHTEAACAALRPMLRGDASYFVEGEAAAAIGKTRSKQAYALLNKALAKDSFHEVIRAGAMHGLAELGDERAIPTLLEWAQYGRPAFAREAAIEALGKLGRGHRNVSARLIDLLEDKNFYARLWAVQALEAMHETDALPALHRLAGQDVDGRLKGAAAAAARGIAEYQERPSELQELRGQIDALKESNRELLGRIDRLEAKRKTVEARNKP